ncbi:MAG: hypothetical protein JHC82_01690 [Stenotrophomonas sp.]|nr:hypothetical protein [Stenotrophomonas sp.]
MNLTLEGHRFHEGAVIHASYDSSGLTWLFTLGPGSGPNPSLNVGMGYLIFGKMHSDVHDFFNPKSSVP